MRIGTLVLSGFLALVCLWIVTVPWIEAMRVRADLTAWSRLSEANRTLHRAIDEISRDGRPGAATLDALSTQAKALPAADLGAEFASMAATLQSGASQDRTVENAARRLAALASGKLDEHVDTRLWPAVLTSLLAAAGLAVAGGAAKRASSRFNLLLRRLDGLAKDVTGEDSIPYAAAPGPIGSLARSIDRLRDARTARLLAEAEKARLRTEQELRQVATDRHTGDFTGALGGVMRVLSEAAKRMDEALQTMALSAGRAGDLAQTSTETAKASAQDLSTVVLTTERLAESVTEIAGSVAVAASTAQDMSKHASTTEQRMAGLAGAAEKVNGFARMIGGIAAQTNLLALNATIEAARAGPAGKGFAVVAAEVKQLARRTAEATGDIGLQISAIQAATREAVGAVQEMAAEVRRMEEMAASIAAAVGRQGDGVRDIATNIAGISQATGATATAMAEAAEAAEEARFTSSEVWYAAGNVGQEAEALAQEFDYFVAWLSADSGEKRLYQRIPCNGAPIVVTVGDDEQFNGFLTDISRGGLALRLADPANARHFVSGKSVTVILPDALGEVAMRVVRLVPDEVGFVAFQTDKEAATMLKAVGYFSTLRANAA